MNDNKTVVNRIMSLVDFYGGSEKKQAFEDVIRKSLPKHIQNVELFITQYQDTVKRFIKDPYITNKASILPITFQAVKFGLYPDPAMGLIYFVPYKNSKTKLVDLTYQLGYKGFKELMFNSGKISAIHTAIVYINDVWEYYIDEKGQHFKHYPQWDKDQGPEVCVYSAVTMKDGVCTIDPMRSDRIDAIKKIVLARTPNSPWSNELYESEMRKKTVLRHHAKLLPMSIEIQIAVEHEEKVELGEPAVIKEEAIDNIMGSIETERDPEPDILTESQKEYTKQL